MSPSDAIEEGAMALFGEKYGDEVRVVSMGEGEKRVSIELCGGTHVHRTGDIGSFRIISESSLAAGIRRIEAAAGLAALKYAESRDDILSEVSEKLKVSASEIPARIQLMQDEKKRLERELSDTRKRMASGGAADSETKTVNGIKFIGQILSDIPAKELKGMADELKKKIGSGIGCGLGFTLGLTILGSAREILGAGSVFGITLLPETTNILMFILPPGAFLTLGYIIAIFNKVKK